MGACLSSKKSKSDDKQGEKRSGDNGSSSGTNSTDGSTPTSPPPSRKKSTPDERGGTTTMVEPARNDASAHPGQAPVARQLTNSTSVSAIPIITQNSSTENVSHNSSSGNVGAPPGIVKKSDSGHHLRPTSETQTVSQRRGSHSSERYRANDESEATVTEPNSIPIPNGTSNHNNNHNNNNNNDNSKSSSSHNNNNSNNNANNGIQGATSPTGKFSLNLPLPSDDLSPRGPVLSGARSSTRSGAISRDASPHRSPRVGPVTMTSEAVKSQDASGRKKVNQYFIERKLGEGSYSKVKLCRDSNNDRLVAVKIMKKSFLRKRKLGMRQNALDNVQREIAIMKKLNHPNVVTLFEVIDDDINDKIYLVLEYMESGSLARGDGDSPVLEPYPEHELLFYMRDVLCGLQYLHSQHIVHRDIKPDNLLRTIDGQIKIADFGVSQLFNADEGTGVTQTAGTAAFLAPEMVASGQEKGNKLDGKAMDIWALGVALFQLAFGRLPFYADDRLELFRVISEEPVVVPDKPEVSADLRRFLLRVLEKDPHKRITMDEMMIDPWITEHGASPLINVKGYDEIVEVSEHDIRTAFSSVDRFALMVKIKTKMMRQRNKARSRLNSAAQDTSSEASGGGSTPRSGSITGGAPGDYSGMGGGTSSKSSGALLGVGNSAGSYSNASLLLGAQSGTGVASTNSLLGGNLGHYVPYITDDEVESVDDFD